MMNQHNDMNKYKVLHFGHCYTNKEGDLSIMLVGGNRKSGYYALFDCKYPMVTSHMAYLGSRVVLNDGNWIEVDKSNVSEASMLTGDRMGRIISPLIDPPHLDFASGIYLAGLSS